MRKYCECVEIVVPKDCCRILFGKAAGRVKIAEFRTARGEDMFVHANAEGRVVEIELLTSDKARKPCQEEDS